jgi:hypothetical protein
LQQIPHNTFGPFLKKNQPQFNIEQALPGVDEISHLKTTAKFLAFFTQQLLLSQASKVPYKDLDKTLSFRDITSATRRDTIALDGWQSWKDC